MSALNCIERFKLTFWVRHENAQKI